MTILLLVVGYFAYMDLPRLEDPEFATKVEAQVKEKLAIGEFQDPVPEEAEDIDIDPAEEE